MNILAVDDEKLPLDALVDAIREACPDSNISACQDPYSIPLLPDGQSYDVAFLDIQMRGISGIELAQKLIAKNPLINIIFVTGYQDYCMKAMSMHASGYVLKPVRPQDIRRELEDLRHPPVPSPDAVARIQCFGNFEVFTASGQPVAFGRSLAREAFAYLVYKRGTPCTTREIAAVLFEDSEYSRKQRGYIQKILSTMASSLRAAGIGEILYKKYNAIAVDTTKVDCDYYRFLQMDPSAINAYTGQFMSQYSWAEFTVGYLDDIHLQQAQ